MRNYNAALFLEVGFFYIAAKSFILSIKIEVQRTAFRLDPIERNEYVYIKTIYPTLDFLY